ncbi:MAG: hypothetical protein QOD85_1180 [Gaiellaceae bacterium]|nr:hypothetical protein [Gaiellaceae bacterium]
MSRLALVLAVVALAGCSGGESGKATLWITRDRGTHVLVAKQVPAGLTAMQALDRVADIDTRYGGRYVQAIDGLAGSISSRRDWFYFVNGYEGDRSAAEYRLRPGDVEWWDFRSWRTQMRQPVVVGAFPEPFLHGYGGHRLPARVVFRFDSQRAAAERLAKLLGGRTIRGTDAGGAKNVNVLVLRGPAKEPTLRVSGGNAPGAAVVFTFTGNPALLLRTVPFGRYRYEVMP